MPENEDFDCSTCCRGIFDKSNEDLINKVNLDNYCKMCLRETTEESGYCEECESPDQISFIEPIDQRPFEEVSELLKPIKEELYELFPDMSLDTLPGEH